LTAKESPNGKSPWYAGRFVRRRSSFGEVDVLASETVKGWQPIHDRQKLFPKSGQVEISGVPAFALRPGDWLAFQVIKNARPRAVMLSISAHRRMPHYLDMATLGSIEAARSLFSSEGWASSRHAGYWAVRFVEDRILVLDLVQERGDKLRASTSSLQRVACYAFDAAHIIPEPGMADPSDCYDPGEFTPLAVYDWSPDADYIARVVRSLSGEKDRRLEELITWLELHRDQSTGQVSASGVDSNKAYEAIRSGELAMRLATDKAVMKMYLSAVRDDPTIARVVSEAAAQSVISDRRQVAIEMKAEFAAEYDRKRELQDQELKERARALDDELEQRKKDQDGELERRLQDRLAALEREAEERAAPGKKALAAETILLIEGRALILEERDRLRSEADRLAEGVAALGDKRRRAEEEISRLSSAILAMTPRVDAPAHSLVHLPELEDDRSALLTIEGLATEISRTALLTPQGKVLMERFATLMLAGELPILEGEQADDFALIAEALMAAGRLVPFDLDATILTPEDIWSRPGSGIMSQVAQAANHAQEGRGTFLIQLRGIERSAARAWYPALALLTRRGLFARRLLLFSTVIDSESDEAKALPSDACRMKIHNAIDQRARLLAPSLLGRGPASIAFHLDPGNRVEDLSPAIAIFAELGAEVSVAMSLRVARVALETLRLRPGDHAAALAAARELCGVGANGHLALSRAKGERKNA
jgi:hypothetical protein